MSPSAFRDRFQQEAPTTPEFPSQRLIEDEDLALTEELAHAEGMLEHPQDEVEEGTAGLSTEALSRAKTFLLERSKQFRKICGYFPVVPQIGSGPNESIDLYWKEKDWELLINIPAESEKMATFYGDDYGSQKIKGSFDPSSFNYGIVPWLTRK